MRSRLRMKSLKENRMNQNGDYTVDVDENFDNQKEPSFDDEGIPFLWPNRNRGMDGKLFIRP